MKKKKKVKVKEVPSPKTVDEFLRPFFKAAPSLNAATAVFSMRKCRNYGDGDIFVIYAAEGTDRIEIVRALKASLKE